MTIEQRAIEVARKEFEAACKCATLYWNDRWACGVGGVHYEAPDKFSLMFQVELEYQDGDHKEIEFDRDVPTWCEAALNSTWKVVWNWGRAFTMQNGRQTESYPFPEEELETLIDNAIQAQVTLCMTEAA